MIVVFRKTDTPRERVPRARGPVAAVVALMALAIVAGAWFWMTRQPMRVELGLPHGVIVAGCGAVIAGLIAWMRAMSLWDVLELVWALVLGVFALIGAVLRAIWNAFLGLIGWD